MEISELRIGNLLEYRGEKLAMVSSLGVKGFETTYSDGSRPNGSSDLTDYEPIPLTEEWLLRMGFESYYKDKSEFQNKHIYLVKVLEDWYIAKYDLKIRYVHQLQNLYFALTGEELKLIDG